MTGGWKAVHGQRFFRWRPTPEGVRLVRGEESLPYTGLVPVMPALYYQEWEPIGDAASQPATR